MYVRSEAPAENSSTILNTRQSLSMTTIDAASSSTSFRPAQSLGQRLFCIQEIGNFDLGTNVNDETRNNDCSIEAVEFGFEVTERAVSIDDSAGNALLT